MPAVNVMASKTGSVKLLVASYDNGSVQQAKVLFTNAGAKVYTTNEKSSKINVRKYDGLIIPGSIRDVWPGYYKQQAKGARNCLKAFDVYRFTMIKKFVLAGKPVYGICGGMQSINVLFGGSLIQDIGGHMRAARTVKISKKSINYKLFGGKLSAYHSHHECVGKVAYGFIATERDAESKHIEALQHKKYPIYAVQYHPEFMGNNGIKIAKKFISVCRKYKKNKIKVDKKDFRFAKY